MGAIESYHTPQQNINSICGDKVWRTDVGLSKAMGNRSFQILEIIKNNDNTKKFRKG